jgi:PmbA protein
MTSLATNDIKDTSHLKKIAESIASRNNTGEQIEVYVSQGSDVEISVYNAEVENMTMANSTAVGIRVINDHREGSAWAESLDEDILLATLNNARENASIAEPDEFAALVKPSDIDDVEPVQRDGWDDSVIETELEKKIAIAMELEKNARSFDDRIKDVPSADYEDGWGHSVVANSHGIVVENSSTTAGASVTVMLGDGESQESSGFSYGRGFNDVNLADVVDMAFSRGVRLLNGTQPISAHVPVIFDPMVTAQFLGIISGMLSGGAVAKGRALLADRLDSMIGHSSLTLIDDPTHEQAFSVATYDSEGMPTRRNVFLENGMLKQFAHTMYSARRLSMKPNACAKRGGVSSRPGAGVRAFYAQPTGESVEDIFSRVGEAIYVQHILGVHSGVNTLSGDFSVGAQGVWIRDGHMADAFKEATIASDLLTILSRISAVANDTWWLPGSTVGNTVLVDEMVMTGK